MIANLTTKLSNGIPEVTPEDLHHYITEHESEIRDKRLLIIDVRRPDEFTGELGHVPGAKLMTLGPELLQGLQTLDKEQKIIFVCRSGARSGQATAHCMGMGFTAVVNMAGGMLRWNELRLPLA